MILDLIKLKIEIDHHTVTLIRTPSGSSVSAHLEVLSAGTASAVGHCHEFPVELMFHTHWLAHLMACLRPLASVCEPRLCGISWVLYVTMAPSICLSGAILLHLMSSNLIDIVTCHRIPSSSGLNTIAVYALQRALPWFLTLSSGGRHEASSHIL